MASASSRNCFADRLQSNPGLRRYFERSAGARPIEATRRHERAGRQEGERYDIRGHSRVPTSRRAGSYELLLAVSVPPAVGGRSWSGINFDSHQTHMARLFTLAYADLAAATQISLATSNSRFCGSTTPSWRSFTSQNQFLPAESRRQTL